MRIIKMLIHRLVERAITTPVTQTFEDEEQLREAHERLERLERKAALIADSSQTRSVWVSSMRRSLG